MDKFGGADIPEGIASMLKQDRDTELSIKEDMRQSTNQDRMSDFPFEFNTAMVLYNSKGEVTVVSGESEVLDAIEKGFIYTEDNAPNMVPSKDFETKIYKSGFFDSPLKNLAKAMEETKMEQKRRELNPNYEPVVGSTSGYEFLNVPRYMTRPFGFEQIGPMDTVRQYNPEKDEYLPKPKPTMSERLMALKKEK